MTLDDGMETSIQGTSDRIQDRQTTKDCCAMGYVRKSISCGRGDHRWPNEWE